MFTHQQLGPRLAELQRLVEFQLWLSAKALAWIQRLLIGSSDLIPKVACVRHPLTHFPEFSVLPAWNCEDWRISSISSLFRSTKRDDLCPAGDGKGAAKRTVLSGKKPLSIAK